MLQSFTLSEGDDLHVKGLILKYPNIPQLQ